MKKIFTAFIMMLCAACVASGANYLTFTAEEDSSTFGIVYDWAGLLPSNGWPDIQYSLDGGETWSELAIGDKIILAKKGDKALIRGYNENGMGHWSTWEGYEYEYEYETESNYQYNYTQFVMTGAIAASGSVMSLIDGIGETLVVPSDNCFFGLFSGCTSLTKAPELPATSLASYCYEEMFSGCTSLTNAPDLPATSLAYGCYRSMFLGCTSLTKAPELPATSLASYCYSGMFSGCTSLTNAPDLPATSLAYGCYMYMFSGCTSLSEIHVSFDDWDKLDATFEWVENVAPSGTFICPENLPLEYGENRIPLNWRVKKVIDGDTVDVLPDNRDLLTFTAEEDSSTFGIVYDWAGLMPSNGWPDIQYSLDGGETWSKLAIGDKIILAKKGDKALIRGYNENGMGHWSTYYVYEYETESNFQYNYTQFVMTGAIAASGSVMSLIDGIGETLVVPSDKCFFSLFSGCTSLTKAPELPATSLASNCYSEMFSGCTSLTNAPELPATTLASYCYSGMFSGCTSLTNAPELPATSLASYCYSRMFSRCTSLTNAPELPATTLHGYCYEKMFSGCTNLTNAPELPATSLADGCYQGMFSGCTSLTNAPNLPATTLEEYCYEKMFSGCTNLTKAPNLPASKLTGSCYGGMFSGCTNLSEISVDFTKWGSGHTDFWVENVAPTGTFYCPKELPLEYGVDRIPEGWTVKHIEVGVNATLADNITIWSDDLTIYVRGAKGEVSIYDLSGKRVADSNSTDEERALSVPAKGVYVVRTNYGTSDVLVR